MFQVKRTHDPLRKEVQNVLGIYEDVKSVIAPNPTRNLPNLIGVVPQPSTPVTTKVKGGNPFADLVKKKDGPSPAVNIKQEKKVHNGQHQSKHGHQKTETTNVKKGKRESGGKTVGNASHRPEERTGVFDQFQNWENADTKFKDVPSSQGESQARQNGHKERKDKFKSSERDVTGKSEDIRTSSYHKRKDSNSRNRERSKSKSDEIHSVIVKTENSADDTGKGTGSSDNKFNGASSAASTPNSQKSTASSGYGSLKPTNSVLSQPHVSPAREHRDSDVSLKSTPSPDAPVFQSPASRTNNTGKPHTTMSPLKSPLKLPNGVSKDINKHRSTSDHSKNKVLKLEMANQVRIYGKFLSYT